MRSDLATCACTSLLLLFVPLLDVPQVPRRVEALDLASLGGSLGAQSRGFAHSAEEAEGERGSDASSYSGSGAAGPQTLCTGSYDETEEATRVSSATRRRQIAGRCMRDNLHFPVVPVARGAGE